MALDTLTRAARREYAQSPGEAERSLNREFLDAAAAVAEARCERRITDAQADNLLRRITATMAEAKISAMANRAAERLSAPEFGGARIGEWFASAVESYKTRED